MGRTESGEIVPADEELRCLVHGFGIERTGDLPGMAALQRQRRAAVGDAVFIAPADAGKARVPVIALHRAADHRHRIGAQMGVEGFHQAEGFDLLVDVDMADHGQRMDAAVGAPGAVHAHLLAGDGLHRLFHCLLHARPVFLPLQAHERAAIEFERQGKAGHSTAPAVRLERSREALAQRVSTALDTNGVPVTTAWFPPGRACRAGNPEHSSPACPPAALRRDEWRRCRRQS